MTTTYWTVATWSNGNGTGERTERRYATRATAERAAKRLRAKRIVCYVSASDEDKTSPPSHWRS